MNHKFLSSSCKDHSGMSVKSSEQHLLANLCLCIMKLLMKTVTWEEGMILWILLDCLIVVTHANLHYHLIQERWTFIVLFSGLCLDQLGGTCLPKRQPKTISHQVVFYSVNGTQVWLKMMEDSLIKACIIF